MDRVGSCTCVCETESLMARGLVPSDPCSVHTVPPWLHWLWRETRRERTAQGVDTMGTGTGGGLQSMGEPWVETDARELLLSAGRAKACLQVCTRSLETGDDEIIRDSKVQ
jgi:hypothetical protein